jgi:hypothetical protein
LEEKKKGGKRVRMEEKEAETGGKCLERGEKEYKIGEKGGGGQTLMKRGRKRKICGKRKKS